MLPTLTAHDVALFAVSYDPPAVLRAFAAEHGIEYPLLSDAGSRVIRELGLLNERVQDDHAAYGIPPDPRHLGVPYPGAILLDADGVVVRKRFHESYRERDTGPGLLADLLGLAAAPPDASRAAAGPVRARAWLDAPDYAFFQRLRLSVEVVVDEGHHVYAAAAPPGTSALAVTVAPVAGLEVGAASWPAPARALVGGRAEPSAVHAGVILGTVPLTFTAPPGAGDHTLRVTVGYQACLASRDLPPGRLSLDLTVRERPLVGRSLPGPRPG